MLYLVPGIYILFVLFGVCLLLREWFRVTMHKRKEEHKDIEGRIQKREPWHPADDIDSKYPRRSVTTGQRLRDIVCVALWLLVFPFMLVVWIVYIVVVKWQDRDKPKDHYPYRRHPW